ncbi:MAG TPA: D-2-hydroxyacid dehydrogenase family protein [Solirubrobacteraceae bacterium]|nr:D-2-hydroxyacid dehydrogenase family protein [Solirubrobacteraceae bacterium]
MIHVAVLDDYQRRAHQWADWSSLGEDVEVEFFAEPMQPDELVAELAPFQVLVLMRERTRFPEAVLAKLAQLQLVVTTGMRNASLDVAHLFSRGVVVSGTEHDPGGAGVSSTIEVAWALILATAKRVTTEDRALREGRWQTDLPVNLSGATLGLLGLGRLGAQMVGPARAFGMEVIAWSQNLTAERAAETGAQLVSREQLFARSDWLSIHLVLSERSRGLVGAAELAAMKPGATLINTSRGPIVDREALVDALRQGRITAGLDVYDHEPLSAGDPLTRVPGAVLLPHLGYVSEAAMRVMYGQVVEDIRAWKAGEPIRRLGG